jgi:hypothetical protein
VRGAFGALAALLAECTIEVERFVGTPVAPAVPTTNVKQDEAPPMLELTAPKATLDYAGVAHLAAPALNTAHLSSSVGA